jgi:RNA polymerase sigma-70 factor, ECF subfamily
VTSEREQLEADIRRRFDAGDLDGAMTAAIDGYGSELFGFLVSLAHDRDRADDAFGAACERMWRSLDAFRWESTFRVWAYTVARHEFLRVTRDIARERRQVGLSRVPAAQEAALQRVRTATAPHLRTEVKDELARIRAELPHEDHMLLTLRLDRQMSWNDIAVVLGNEDATTLARDAAALRKRYERLKERLAERLGAG